MKPKRRSKRCDQATREIAEAERILFLAELAIRQAEAVVAQQPDDLAAQASLAKLRRRRADLVARIHAAAHAQFLAAVSKAAAELMRQR